MADNQNQGAFWGAVGGFIIGSFLGNPLAGLTYGASIGSLFDKKEDSPTYDFNVSRNPRSENMPIPVVYGLQQVSGNVIFETEPGPKSFEQLLFGEFATQLQLDYQNITIDSISIFIEYGVYHRNNSPLFVFGPNSIPKTEYIVNWESGTIYFTDGSILQHVYRGNYKVKVSGTYTPTTVTEKKIQIGLSEGPIQSVSNILVNGIPIDSVLNSSYSIYLGTANQEADARNPHGETFHYLAHLDCTFTATQQLSGTTDISCIVAGRLVNIWNADTGEWVNEWSDNPAYCLLDWLTNKRYGCGEPIEKFNLETFKSVAAYCDELINDEPRYRLNINIDSKMEARDSIEMILQAFAGFLFEDENGLICLGVEKSESPVHFFTPENIVQGSFSYTPFPSKASVPNRLYIEFKDYTDPSGKWPMSKILIEDEIDMEMRRENNIHPVVVDKTIQLRGIIHPSQAGRIGQLIFDYERICPVVCSLRGGIDASLIKVGQVVSVTHDVPGWTNKLFRVIALEHHENYETTFTLREYNGNIYHDRPVVYIPGSGTSLSNPFTVPDVTDLEVTEQSYTTNAGVVITGLKATFTLPLISNFSHCTVEYSSDGGTTWKSSASVITGEAFIQGLEINTYYAVRVKVVNSAGIASAGVTSDSVQVIGYDLPPAAPTNLAYNWNTADLVVNWGAVITNNDGSLANDIKDYKVEVYVGAVLKHTKNSVQANIFTYDYNQNINDNPPNGATQVTIKVYARDFAENLSGNSQLLCTCPMPIEPTITATAEIARIQIVAGLNNIQLQNYMKLQIKASQVNGFNPDTQGTLIHDNPSTIYGHSVDTGSTWYYRARIVNKFGVASGWSAQVSATADKIDESDMMPQILLQEVTANPMPTSGTLANMRDGVAETGATFTSGTTITIKFVGQQSFSTLRINTTDAVSAYTQYFNDDTQTWVDWIGTAGSPLIIPAGGKIFNAGPNTNYPYVHARQMRLVTLGACTINELRFGTIGQIDDFYADKIKTGMIEAGAVTIGPNGALQANIPMAVDPATTRVWRFDNSLYSTSGDQPLPGYVAPLIPDEGVFGGCVEIARATTNLIQNSIFEGTEGMLPANWIDQYANNKATVDKTVLLYGNNTVKFDNSDPRSYAGIISLGYIDISNQEYTLSVYFRSSNGNQRCYAGIIYYDNNYKELGYDYPTLLNGFPGTNWTRYQGTFNPITRYADCTKIRIRLLGCYQSTGMAWAALPQLEAGTFATSHVNGTRAEGNLSYSPLLLNQAEFTIFMKWFPYTETGLAVNGYSARFFELNTGLSVEGQRIVAYRRNGTKTIGLAVPNSEGTAEVNLDFTIDGADSIINKWHSIAFVKNDNKIRIHFNDQYAELPISQPALVNFTKFFIGCTQESSFRGQANALFDELLISSVAATPEQIKAWANSNSPFYLASPAIDAGSQNIVAGNIEFTGEGQKNYAIGMDAVRRVVYEQDIFGNMNFYNKDTGNLVWKITSLGELKDASDYTVIDVNGRANGKIIACGMLDSNAYSHTVVIGNYTVPEGRKLIGLVFPIGVYEWELSNSYKTIKVIGYDDPAHPGKYIDGPKVACYISFNIEGPYSSPVPAGSYENLTATVYHYTESFYMYTDATYDRQIKKAYSCWYEIKEVIA